jgi:hypothetical protein
VTWDGHLYTVDPATGATTLVADTGTTAITGLVWEAASGCLLAVNYDGPCNLTRIDPTTGASTTVGPTGVDNCTGFDRDPSTGTLYMDYNVVGGRGSVLATVEPTTGDATDIAPVTLAVGGGMLRIASLAVRADGTLLGISYGGDLYTIDAATGVATLLTADVIGGPTGIAANYDCSAVLYVTDGQELFTVDVTGATFADIGPMFTGDGNFSENLTVACGVPVPPTPPAPPAPPARPAPPTAEPVWLAPRFTG